MPLADLKPGDRIADRYRVEELLGRGGMGVVYRATEEGTGRALAIKLLLPELAESVDLSRFAREGAIGAKLGRLPGFVPVHAAGEHLGTPYLAMAFVEGSDLKATIDELDAARLAQTLALVARSMHACHQEGVVHRDLKPANVLIDRQGAPWIADLGLARTSGEALTQTGEVLGTPAYMAPEQIRDARAVDARSDVYALGAILYRGLAGRPPFSGTLYSLLDQVLTQEPPLPSSLGPEVSPDLERVCLRAMAKDPQARYPDAESLAEDLERIASGGPLEVRPGRSRLPLALVAITLALLAGLGYHRSSQVDAAPASPTPAADDEAREVREALLRDYRALFLTSTERPTRGEARRLTRRVRAAPFAEEDLKLEAFRDVQEECGRRLASNREPSQAYRTLRAACGEALARSPEVAAVSSLAFAQLLSSERWSAVLKLQEARLPLPPLDFVRSATARKLASARHRPDALTVRACLELDVTLRPMGPTIFSNLALPRGTRSLCEPRSASRAFVDLLATRVEAFRKLLERSRKAQKLVWATAREVLEAPLQNLGLQYRLEVEWLLAQRERFSSSEGTAAERAQALQGLTRVRKRLEKEWSLGLLYDVASSEQECLPSDDPKAVELWHSVLQSVSRTAPPYAPPLKDRLRVRTRTAAILLLELIARGEWVEAEKVSGAVSELIPPQVRQEHRSLRHLEALVSAWRHCTQPSPEVLASHVSKRVAELATRMEAVRPAVLTARGHAYALLALDSLRRGRRGAAAEHLRRGEALLKKAEIGAPALRTALTAAREALGE